MNFREMMENAKKLFTSMMLLVCSALTIFAGVVVFICYHTYRGAAFSELRNTANIIAMTDADPAVIGDKIDKTVEEYHIRVTFYRLCRQGGLRQRRGHSRYG